MSFSALKDPDSVLDFKIDWATYLAGASPADTISTSTWTADSGITVDSDSNTTTTATVWLSGGTAGTTYELVNRIVTAGGRTDERTLRITVVER